MFVKLLFWWCGVDWPSLLSLSLSPVHQGDSWGAVLYGWFGEDGSRVGTPWVDTYMTWCVHDYTLFQLRNNQDPDISLGIFHYYLDCLILFHCFSVFSCSLEWHGRINLSFMFWIVVLCFGVVDWKKYWKHLLCAKLVPTQEVLRVRGAWVEVWVLCEKLYESFSR